MTILPDGAFPSLGRTTSDHPGPPPRTTHPGQPPRTTTPNHHPGPPPRVHPGPLVLRCICIAATNQGRSFSRGVEFQCLGLCAATSWAIVRVVRLAKGVEL
eukprot:4949280-Amphidinium_carterae.1